jgi:hypothetical protein
MRLIGESNAFNPRIKSIQFTNPMHSISKFYPSKAQGCGENLFGKFKVQLPRPKFGLTPRAADKSGDGSSCGESALKWFFAF